jgi:hypothetical protein
MRVGNSSYNYSSYVSLPSSKKNMSAVVNSVAFFTLNVNDFSIDDCLHFRSYANYYRLSVVTIYPEQLSLK